MSIENWNEQAEALEQKRNVFVNKYRMPVNTNLKRADEIEYALETQLLDTPKDNYVGLTDVKKPIGQIAKEALAKVPWQAFGDAAQDAVLGPRWLRNNQLTRAFAANAIELARTAGAQVLTQGNMLDTVLGNKERAEKWTKIMQELNDPSRPPETLLKDAQSVRDFFTVNPEKFSKNPFLPDPNDEAFKHKMELWEQEQKRIDEFNNKVKVITHDFMERTGIARTEKDGWLYDTGSVVFSIAGSVGLLLLTKNPTVLAAIFGASEAQGVYEDAIEAGVEPAKAYGLGTIAGGANALLEQIGGEAILSVANARGIVTKGVAAALKKSGKKAALTTAALGAARGGMVEGSEEFLQSIATDTIENLGDVQQKQVLDILKDATKAGLLGTLGGTFGGGPQAYSNYVTYTRAIQTSLEGVGVPKESAAAIAREIANEATSKELSGELLDAIEAETDSPITAEQRDAQAFAQAFTQQQQREIDRTAWKVGDKVEQDSLKTGMKPELAKANGQVAQTLVNNIYRLAHLTPAEFSAYKIDVIDGQQRTAGAPLVLNQSALPERDLFATHNMNLAGAKNALKMGGLAMPSMAIRSTKAENVSGFGEVSFVANEQLVKPSRGTEVYDRDAWTPSIYNKLKYRLGQNARQRIADILKKSGEEKKLSMYLYNIQERMGDSTHNELALDLYMKEKGLPESARSDAYFSPDYIAWYNENLLDNSTPYLLTENDDNTDLVERKLTLNNVMKVLRKQERAAGGYIGDHLMSVQELIKFFPQKFKNLKEVHAKKQNLQDTEQIFKKIEELDNDFAELVNRLRTSGKEKEYGADWHAAGLAIANTGDKELQLRWLENAGLRTDEKALAEIDQFAQRLKDEIPVGYFEVKPRRVVNFNQFSGVIMPNTKDYDTLAKQLETEHHLPVMRVEKGNTQQYKEALAEIQKMVPTTFFQRQVANLTELHNQVTGEAIPLETNENLKPFTPVELKSDFLPMAQTAAQGKENVANAILGKENKITVQNGGKNFVVNRRSIKKMYNTALNAAINYANKHNLSIQERRQLYHEATEQLTQALKVFETAQLVLSHDDVKNVPGRKIHRYGNVFTYKGKPYFAMFVAKQDGTLADLHLYDLQAEQQVDIENKMAAGISSGASTPSQQRLEVSVADMENFVKQKIAKYNNDFQTFNQENVRGQVNISDNARQAIIKIFQGQSDPSTVIHELAHVYLSMLNNAAQVSVDPEFHQLIRDLNAWLGEPQGPNGTYSEQQQEKFAQSFEAYLAQGKAPTPKLQSVFEKFAQWLADVYKGVKDYLKIEPEVAALFDRLMAAEEPIKKSKYVGNTQRAKELLQAIKTGFKNEDSLELAEMKELLKVASTRRPGKPKTHLLKELRYYGADYSNTARIDKEQFANAGVKNKKGGIGDDPARWLMDHGYMSGQDAQTYEDQSALDDAAYDLIDRALAGEEIYKIEDQDRVQQIAAYDENLAALQEVFPNLLEVASAERAIADLESKGYRVVNKQDLDELEKQLDKLNRAAEKPATDTKKPDGEKALTRQAQQIRDVVIKEIDKRALTNKQQLKEWLAMAQNAEQLREAVANVLDYLEQEYEKSPDAQAEKSRLAVPNTDYDALKLNILKELNRINTENADKVKQAREVIKRTGQILTKNIPLNSEEDAARKKAFQTLHDVLDEPFRRSIYAALAAIRHLPAADKGKFLRTFISPANMERLPSVIDDVLNRAKEIEERNYKKYMEGKIEELLQQKLFNKSGALRTAILDQESTAALLSLRRVFMMTKDEAATELANRHAQFQEEIPTTMTKLENGLLSIRSRDLDDVTPQLFKSVYDGLAELRRAGKSAMNLQKMIRDFRKSRDVEEAVKAVHRNKKSGLLKNLYARWLGNWESILNLVTNSEVKEKYSMLSAEADAQVYSWQRRKEIMDKVKKAYRLNSNWDFQRKLNDLNQEAAVVTNYGLVDRNPDPAAIRKFGEPFEEKLTKLQVMNLYIWNMNPVLSQRLHSAYGESQLNHLFNTVLDNQDKAVCYTLQKEAEKTYDKINEVFIRERGYELPRVQAYFPSVTERVESEVDYLVADASIAKNPGFLKSRVDSSRILQKPSNPFSILWRHIDRAGDYHYKAEKLNHIRSVFKDRNFKKAVEAKFGEDVFNQLTAMIDQMGMNRRKMKFALDGVGDFLTNNYVRGAIAAKPNIAIKQLVSSINYAENMPPATWAKYFAKALANPKQTIKFMIEADPYIKARFESGSMNEALSHVLAQQKAGPGKGYLWQQFDTWMTLNTRLGDVGAIIFGGKPYIDYLMNEKGMSKKDAVEQFRKSTMRSQQANTKSSLSAYQAQDMNFITRALFAFKNTGAQYARKIADSLIEYQRGDITKKQLAKNVAIYGLLNSWLYSLLTDLWLVQLAYGWISGDGDDDDAFATMADDLIFSPVTQMAGSLPFLDMGVENAIRFITDHARDQKFRFRSAPLPVADDLVKLGNRALKEDMEMEDVLTLLAEMGQTLGGIPTRYFKGAAKGAYDVASGENPMRGFLQMLGYTEHRAKKVTASED